jgi:hypothetical protein
MKPFTARGGVRLGWVIEQRDVGVCHLLAGGEELVLRNDHVGLLYVCDSKNGDRLEVAPHDPTEDEAVSAGPDQDEALNEPAPGV